MPKKPRTPSSRLARWREISRRSPFKIPRDWSDEAVWVTAARDALDLDSPVDERWDKPLREAFKNFELDPRDPFSWRLLLGFYAQSHVSRGRPAEWDSESLCKLLRHISQARKKRPSAKASEIFRALIRQNAPYHGKTESYLKHGYRLALDIERNDQLRLWRDRWAQGYLDVLRAGYEEKGWAVTASDERRIENLVLDEALESLGAPNVRWVKK